MTLQTATELRTTLKIGRSTLYRLLYKGLHCIGKGRLRRFDLEAVLKWLNGDLPAKTSTILQPGLYRCLGCQSVGKVLRPLEADRIQCRLCQGSRAEPVV